MCSDHAWRPGTVIAQRYRVVREIGRGGMGVVLAATALQLKQPVALKLLLAGTRPDAVKRFVREARIIAGLRSEHVCRVLDSGFTDTGEPFTAMELLEGGDLAAILEQRGALPVEEAVQLVLHACEGIAEAHLAGVVHRDLKPSNLFVTHRVDGTPLCKVLDFGIAKVADRGPNLTQDGALLGSPQYMAPEQLEQLGGIDARTDIWAIGVTLFELLSAQRPFGGTSTAELHASILRDPPMALSELRSDVPPELCAVIDRCLRKQPDERYVNVAALTAALAPFAPPTVTPEVNRIRRMYGGDGAVVRTDPPPRPRSDNALATTAHAGGLVATSSRAQTSSKAIMLIVAALCVVAIAGVAIGVTFSKGTKARTEGPKKSKKRNSERAAPKVPCDQVLCAPELALRRDSSIDPSDRLRSANKLARKVEPKAELVMITANGLRANGKRDGRPRADQFSYRYPLAGGKFGGLVVAFMARDAHVARYPVQQHNRVNKPGCRLSRVLELARKKGFPPATPIRAVYAALAHYPQRWTITEDTGRLTLYVDEDCTGDVVKY